MSPVLFNPAKDDAALLAQLHRTAFADPWDKAAICELFAGPGVFVYFTQDGFVMARAAGGEAEILTLAVAVAARAARPRRPQPPRPPPCPDFASR